MNAVTDNDRSPFSPGFGKVPPIYLKREDDISRVKDNIGDPNSPYQTTLVYGMRGTGKTAFITDVSHEIEKRDNWIAVNLVMGTPLLQTLVNAIYMKAEQPLKKLIEMIGGISVSAFGITISAENGHRADTQQYQWLLESMLKRLKDNGKWLLISIDEVKSTPEVRQFAAVYQLMLREGYNISLLMTGFPQHVSELQNDDVLTFLLRAGRITLTPLDLWEIKASYAKAFLGKKSISDETLTEITRLTEGYAYAFQLLGYYLWDNSDDRITKQTVNDVMPLYKTDLYRNAYMKMYQSLSDMEREFLKAMAQSGDEAGVADIAARLGKEKNYVSMYRRRLLDTQLITAPRRGYLKFSLPLFREFVNERSVLYE